MFNKLFIAATACATAALVLPAADAQAAVTFAFQASDSSLSLTPGEARDVNVYLRESLTGGDTSLLVAENGLSRAQVTVERASSAGLSDPAGIGLKSRNEFQFPGTTFDFSAPPTLVDLAQQVGPGTTSGPTGTTSPSVGGLVYLLTLTVTAGDVVGETTTFNVFDTPGFDETMTFGSTILDSQIAPTSIAVSVVPVPEPASLGLALLALPLLARRRR